MNRKARTFSALFLSLSMVTSPIYAVTDREVLSSDIENTYVARNQAKDIISNINFVDVSDSHWAKEAIIRLGAIDVIKGYNQGNNRAYSPDDEVSNQEALAFILRVLGMEEEAQQASAVIEQNPESPDHILTLWSKGYLQVANQLGLIDNDAYDDALVEEQSELDGAVNFLREAPVSREQVAQWLVDAINDQQPDLIEPIYTQQAIFNYDDWEDISSDKVPYIEAVTTKQIMNGDGTSFNPKDNLTRAEMAQVLKNVDDILYNTMNITRKNGIVAHISDSNDMGAGNSTATRNILIRTEDGTVDEISYTYNKTAIDKIFTKDVPVFSDRSVKGLLGLREGEYIEYLVENDTNEMLYISSEGVGTSNVIEGVLQPLDLEDGTITIKNDDGISFDYKMIDGIYNVNNNTLKINDGFTYYNDAPVNSTIQLTLQNNIVTKIEYIGDQVLYDEVSGMVKDNNPVFGYITIIDWNGNEVTKQYEKGNLSVEKQKYYDTEDEIGYIDEVFPDYRFDPRDSTIEEIEAGDIVHLRLNPLNKNYVQKISAKTNYVVKFGTIKDLVNRGSEGFRILVEYDDLTTNLFDVNANVPIKQSNKTVPSSMLKEGDTIKMLVNQAVLEPGTVKETIKEIVIDEYGNTVSNLYRGQLGNWDKSQRTITLLNTYTLGNTGWRDYTKTKKLDISNKNIEYYKDGNRIDLDFANNYLRNDHIEVYVAMEKYYDQEKVLKVTFRDGRDSVLNFDNVTYSAGGDRFKMLQSSNFIDTDNGTIVVKNGKLVEDGNILSPDYAQVVMNGNNRAAVVNITPEPGNDATSIFRGRIQSIDSNESFQVQSHSVLKDMSWIYSPIPRMFTVGYDTVIIDEDGMIPQSEFIDYSAITKVDQVYTIISDGTKAKYLIKNPYTTEGLKGEIYELGDNLINIKDTIVYDREDSTWKDLSYTNSYAEINLLNNSIILKNNKIISQDELQEGDKIRVLTTEFLIDKLKLEDARDVQGYVILVEK